MTIAQILEATFEAYSKDRYTENGWKKCISILKKKGASSEQCIWFLMSKHMRWAADCYSKSTEYGKFTQAALTEYLNNYPQYATQKELNSLEI